MGEVLIFYILGYTGNLQHFNVKYVLVRYNIVENMKKKSDYYGRIHTIQL